jgi:SprA-related family
MTGVSPVDSVASRDPRDANVFRPRVSAQDGSIKAASTADSTQPGQGQVLHGTPAARADGKSHLGPKQLKPADQRLVEKLSDIDQKVRAHEAAHEAAAGSLGGAVTFTYQTGPDGKSYAVGGEVPIDMSSGRTPEETLARAAQIRAAALAPADPSPQDLAVAAEANQMETAAREQMITERALEMRSRSARAESGPVLGEQAVHGKDVQLQRRAVQPAGASGGEQTRSSSPSSVTSSASAVASTSAASQPDVGEQAAATLAAVSSYRAAAGVSTAQLQQMVRLAAAAYRM